MLILANSQGAWLCHCHIGWHTDEGFDLQVVERYDDIVTLMDETSFQDNCDAWNTYVEGNSVVQDDAGV